MKKINFMPETFSRARARRRALNRMAIVLVALLAGGWVYLKIESGKQLESMRAELTALQEQARLVEADGRARRGAVPEVQVQLALEAPVPAATVISTIAERTSPSVGLISLSLAGETVDPRPAGGDRKKRKKSKNGDEAGPPPLRLVLEGLAPDDMTVARLIEQLDTQPLFERVALGFCRPTEDGVYEARNFQITAEVPLDRTVIADGRREVDHAD